MKNVYRSDLKAEVSLDHDDRVLQILHLERPWLSGATDHPLLATVTYLQQMAPVFAVAAEQLLHLDELVSFAEPRLQGAEYRLAEEKRFFDSVTYGFYQTSLNVPVWQAGLSVTLEQNPLRVVASVNTTLHDVAATLPTAEAIASYQQIFHLAQTAKPAEDNATLPFLLSLLGVSRQAAALLPGGRRGVSLGRFFLYRYEESQRIQGHLTLPLAPVPPEVQGGQYYLVAELVFSWPLPQRGMLSWRALVEVESDAVLYLEALGDGVSGLVFTYDPITSTGDTENNAARSSTDLEPFRDLVVLSNLGPPVEGMQSLVGSNIELVDVVDPRVAPPRADVRIGFNYAVRTNEFSAVNAYYHADQVFASIADLGFPLSDYFDGTRFPVQIDHRDENEEAFCNGDGEGDGIGLVSYNLGHPDTVFPIGRAVDKWVHWHEIGGHGILLDHVRHVNFKFAHSAGDGLAALQNDPESRLRPTDHRFTYAPFRWPPGNERKFNRAVGDGWAWGGLEDRGGLRSEQILATTHFRIYRSLGGDAADVAGRWFASRAVTYLILRAVSTLTPFTNPGHALTFCIYLMAVDLLKWTTEGLVGGAYNKVIRWSFEKQGLFQPFGAPTPVQTEGAPPAVDVYIEDGRNGEYPYKADYWNHPSIWNRHAPDGGTAHQPPIPGKTSYAYVKVKNRGTTAASDVVVKGYYSPPGAGFAWPHDFEQMEPLAGITIPSLKPNHAEEKTVGPFAWTPQPEFRGQDGLLMIAATDLDGSNVRFLLAGESIEEWRLVPHDNNVAKRNVHLVPGDGGGILKALHECLFVARNPFHKPAALEARVHLPKVLAGKGWQIGFQEPPGARFNLGSGEKRELVVEVKPGDELTRDDVRRAADRDVTIELLGNGILLGGMTYRLDPEL